MAARYGVAVLGGLLLTAAFPRMGLAGAAWVGPALILFSGLGSQPRQVFKLGYLAGLVHFLSSLYWLLNIPFTFHGLPLAPALGWLALSAYCALYPAIWAWLCWRIFSGQNAAILDPTREGGVPPPPKYYRRIWPWTARPATIPPSNHCVSFPAAQAYFFSTRGWQRQAWAFCCAAIWVALELVRGRFLSGFPWNFLGNSQYQILPLIQMASATGVFGVSFLIIWTSTALGAACLTLLRRPMPVCGPWGEIGLPLLATAAAALYGASQVQSIAPPPRQLKVALVQPSIPQTLIWDDRQDAARFARAMSLSLEASAAKPALLIWPESALPPLTPEIRSELFSFITRHRLWMLVSADDEKTAPNGTAEYFNASFLLGPTAATEGVYYKRRLVIFGEYVPLAKWLPFLRWLTSVDVGYTPGTQSVQFQMRDPPAKLSVLICFEDVFPDEAREHVQADTDFLVNLTNDGWFGDDGAQWQQAASAVFRAVENGVPLVRSTNNGLTCWIDANGRLRQILRSSGNGSVYAEGFMVADIPLRAGGRLRPTFYNRHGDWFGWACVGISVILWATVKKTNFKLQTSNSR